MTDAGFGMESPIDEMADLHHEIERLREEKRILMDQRDDITREARKALVILCGSHAGLASVTNSAHEKCDGWCEMAKSIKSLDAALRR